MNIPLPKKNQKTYTLLFIPSPSDKVVRVDISPRILYAGWVLSAIFLTVFLTFSVIAYSLLHKESQMVALARQSQQQKEEIVRIYSRLQEIHGRLLDLTKKEDRIRMIMDPDGTAPDSGQLQGVGGPESLAAPAVLIQKGQNGMLELMEEMDRQFTHLGSGMSYQEGSLVSLKQKILDRAQLWASTPSIWPTHGVLTSGFGWRNSPFGIGRDFHPGIDIAGRVGLPVIATASGVVSFSGWDQGFGKSVRIDHANGFETLYAHLEQVVVYENEKVTRGEVIGYLGNTGLSTGPHLHYGVIRNRVPVDPTRYIIDF